MILVAVNDNDEEYYPDEPSLNAIRYLLWSVASDVSGEFVFSDSKVIELMAITAHDILEEAFEEAPINEQLADDIKSQLSLATEGFDQLRSVLMWVYTGCYLTTGGQNAALLSKHVEELLGLEERGDLPEISPGMAFFYASTKCIFDYQIGPLALYPKDYLAAMMRTKDMEQQIAYFADREQLKDFLEEKIRFQRHMLNFIDEHEGELPTLFIDTEEPKDCLQFFYGYSPYIAGPANPFYDKEKAREGAVNLLWDAEAVTTHALNYLLEHNYLPDIYDDEVLSRFSTPTQKRHDIDFLMRFYRRENY